MYLEIKKLLGGASQNEFHLLRFASYRPESTKKSVSAARCDDVLITSDAAGALPWARAVAFYSIEHAGQTTSLVMLQLYTLVEATKWIDSLTYAPHLRLTQQFRLATASSIVQRIYTCPDTRVSYTKCVWVNWFLTWGPLKYPIEHRDRICEMPKGM